MARSRAEQLLPLLRELRALERRRTAEGLTPLDYQRWLDLRQRLARRVSTGELGDDPEKARATRMLVEFAHPRDLARAWIHNLARGGLFIATPFVAEIGTQLDLRIRVSHTSDDLLAPAEVVSNHVGDGFRTTDFGMGVQFKPLPPPLKGRLEALKVAGARGGRPGAGG